MEKRVEWVDGMKGYACLIVLLGHSVGCVFPNMIFGDSYQAHGVVEQIIHMSPLNLLFASGHMNGLFFFLSGWIIAQKSIKRSFLERLVTKYLKFVLMVCWGGITAYFVMRNNLTYHIQLMPYSYAAEYVQWSNTFEPGIIGQDGILRDVFITAFTDVSRYDSPLWFLTVLFWGSLVAESFERVFSSKREKVLFYVVIYCIVTNLEHMDWRIPYAGYIFAGAAVSHLRESVSENLIKEISEKWSIVLFLLGLYLTAPGEFIGFYYPLRYLAFMGMHMKLLGIMLIVLSVDHSSSLQRMFTLRASKWLNKYSFGIYVSHWAVVISITCAVTFHLYAAMHIDYMISGMAGILSGLIVTLIVSKLYTEDIYKPLSGIAMRGLLSITSIIGDEDNGQ